MNMGGSSVSKHIWSFFVIIALIFGLFSGKLSELPVAAMDAAKQSVELSITMLGVYMLWTGLLNIGQRSGMNDKMAGGLGKLLSPLFPGVRGDQEAMAAICMNLAANTLGMGSAATPFGMKAMARMNELQHPTKATYDMIMFLVLNTSSLLLIPTSIIALRTASGSAAPFSVTVPIILDSILMTVVGVATAVILGKGER